MNQPGSGSRLARPMLPGARRKPIASWGIVLCACAIPWDLAAADGGTDIVPPADAAFEIEEISALSEGCVGVRVLLTVTDPVEGFVTAVRHDPALTLESVTIVGTAAEQSGADFASYEVLPEGGTAGVVMDLEPPFDGNVIAPGEDLPIVVYRYCCPKIEPGQPEQRLALDLVDGELGTPPKENTIVVAGMSVSPALVNGAVVVAPPPPEGDVDFLVGGPIDDDGLPTGLLVEPGSSAELSFYYRTATPASAGLQGLSMALSHDCGLEIIESSFRLPPDSAAVEAGVEYSSFHADNDPDDGDGCEMVLGMLADVNPPFEGNVLPPSVSARRLAAVDVRVRSEVACDQCMAIEFTDGVNGRGKIPVRNLYASESRSYVPGKVPAEPVCALAPAIFKRGDCNGDQKVNTTDAAAVILFLFPWWSVPFSPDCLDACDAADNGTVDVTDAVRILNWLFQYGQPLPPPGTRVAGPDPTDDELTCERRPCP